MESNTNTFNAWVNWYLDLHWGVQATFNTVAQAVKYIATNKWRPSFLEFTTPLGKQIAKGLASTPGAYKVMQVLEEFIKEWMKPNLGGIVIEAVVERQGREVDVSENMIIMQSHKPGESASRREYNTDNSAPHARTWHIEGYLTQSIPMLDELFSLRPTLVLQQAMLDAFAVSRRPVIYRSALCPWFTKVLITRYELGRQIEGTQAYQISIDLREFIPYYVPIFVDPNNPSASYDATSGVLAAAIDEAPAVEVPVEVPAP